jgi:hypothetical protein
MWPDRTDKTSPGVWRDGPTELTKLTKPPWSSWLLRGLENGRVHFVGVRRSATLAGLLGCLGPDLAVLGDQFQCGFEVFCGRESVTSQAAQYVAAGEGVASGSVTESGDPGKYVAGVV